LSPSAPHRVPLYGNTSSTSRSLSPYTPRFRSPVPRALEEAHPRVLHVAKGEAHHRHVVLSLHDDPVPPVDQLHLVRGGGNGIVRSEEHTSELQSRSDLVCRLLLEKKKQSTWAI